MSVSTWVAQVLERGAHRLELDAGVEQALDDPQLEQVAVAVEAAAAAAAGVGERRPDEIGARPVVELAVGDADDGRRLGAAVTVFAHGSRSLICCLRLTPA